MQSSERRELATTHYLRSRRRNRLVVSCLFVLFVASIVFAHVRSADDWSRFNHRAFPVVGVLGGDKLLIDAGGNHLETVQLRGIVAPTDDAHSPSCQALGAVCRAHRVTLLLPVPQTRDPLGHLLAYAYVDGSNVSVELVKSGLVYADRQQTSIMSGLIDPAESEARKKNRGLWKDLKFDQMPAWRQAWLRGLRQQNGKNR